MLIISAVKYTACLTASHNYLGKHLALEDFSCMSNKSVALALLAKFVAVLVSKMEFFSVPAPNTYNGFVLDFLGHFPLYVIDISRSIKTWCAVKCIAELLTILFDRLLMKVLLVPINSSHLIGHLRYLTAWVVLLIGFHQKNDSGKKRFDWMMWHRIMYH